MNGLPYYKRYPRDFFEGTAGLKFDLKGAYGLVLDLIYMQGGKLPDDAHYISGLLGLSARKWNVIRLALIKMEKITADCGIISNFRADNELIISRSYQDNKAKNRSKPNKINGLQSRSRAGACLTEPDTDTEEKPSGFSRRASAQKPQNGGWVHQRTTRDAAETLLKELDDGLKRIEDGNGGAGKASGFLPAADKH